MREWEREVEIPDTLVEMWEASVARHPGRPVFGTRDALGRYTWATYGEVGRRVGALRAALARAGIAEGDAVGVISNNRAEWAIAAFATYGLGGRFVPMYEAELPKTWAYIIRDSGLKLLFVSSVAIRDRVEALRGELPGLGRIVSFDARDATGLGAFEAEGRAAPVPSRRPGADEVAQLIYTSGTTGEPKGVLLSHRNFTSNVQAALRLFTDVDENSVSLSILPWAHAMGQTADLYGFTSVGGSIGIAGGPTTIAADLMRVRPTHLIAVPRVFNRAYDGIWATMRAKGGATQRLFEAAVAAAHERRRTGVATIRNAILDKLVLAKIRARFGGRFKGSISGSAKMNLEIAEFFHDVGLPVYDCYGMTETAPAVTMNGPRAFKLGTVGRPIEGVRVVIDRSRVDDGTDEGEIVVYGPNVMLGYHNKPEATAAVMTADGGLRTGDRGRLDEDGYLWITGRFKEQFKLENGKYVFPAAIEEALQLVSYVVNAIVVGDGRPYNVALIVVDPAALERRAHELGLAISPEDFAGGGARVAPDIAEALGRDVAAHLEGQFGSYEIPKKFLFTTDAFTVDNGLLTPTLKLKRREVMTRYGSLLEALFS